MKFHIDKNMIMRDLADSSWVALFKRQNKQIKWVADHD